jgi:hypothetical protein
LKGKEPDSQKYTGGTIFIDHASGFIFVVSQVSLGAAETVCAKHAFEREAKTCGVNVEHCCGDNGVSKTNKFKKDLSMHGKTVDGAGVGAHHQSGVAERAIQTLSERARAMMLHAAIHWPSEFSFELWLFAVDYAVYLWNHLPQQNSKIAPIEQWCGVCLNWMCYVWLVCLEVQHMFLIESFRMERNYHIGNPRVNVGNSLDNRTSTQVWLD